MTPGSPRRLLRTTCRAALLAIVLAACGPAPSPAPTATEVSIPGGPQVLACIGVEPAECRRVVMALVATLPNDRPTPYSMTVELMGCQDGLVDCPHSLDGQPGWATVDFTDGGEPMDFAVSGPSAAPRVTFQDQAWDGLQEPVSAPVGGPGPVPFQVTFCGLMHKVDFDGSFWVPIGEIAGDAHALYAEEAGTMARLGPNLAEYRGSDGFVMRLARYPGSRQFICD